MTEQVFVAIGEEDGEDADLSVTLGTDDYGTPIERDAFGTAPATPSQETQIGGGTNLIRNGSFEAPAVFWSAGAGWSFPVAHASAFHGSTVAQLTAVAGGTQGSLTSSEAVPIDITMFYWATASSWMASLTRGSGRMLLHEYDGTGAFLRSTVVGEVFEADTGWYTLARRFGPRSHEGGDVVWHIDTTTVRVSFESTDDAVLTWHVDGVQVAQGLERSAFSPGGTTDGIDGGDIIPGTIPPIAIDTTPPAAPTNLRLSSQAQQMADASVVTVLAVAFDPAPDEDLGGTEVYATREFTQSDPADINTRQPVWSASLFGYVAAADERDLVTIQGVLGGWTYWVRARSVDKVGNRSDWSGVVRLDTLIDADAPAMPAGITTTPGFRGVAVAWLASGAADLAHYEVRWRPTGSSVDWLSMRTRATVQFITDLTPDLSYDFQVRAEDTSGNVVSAAIDPRPVNGLQNPEAGWSAVVTGVPSAIGAADIATNAVRANHILAGEIKADKIGAGLIKANTQNTEIPDGFEVVSAAGKTLGRWDENGLIVRDGTSESTRINRWVEIASGSIRMTTNGGTVAGGTYDVAITPDGIDATAIRLGVAPGGHNLIRNSSFELSGTVAVFPTISHDTSAEWNANIVGSADNLTVNATSLTMTAVTF